MRQRDDTDEGRIAALRSHVRLMETFSARATVREPHPCSDMSHSAVRLAGLLAVAIPGGAPLNCDPSSMRPSVAGGVQPVQPVIELSGSQLSGLLPAGDESPSVTDAWLPSS